MNKNTSKDIRRNTASANPVNSTQRVTEIGVSSACPNSPTGYHWLVGTGDIKEQMVFFQCKYCVEIRWLPVTWDKCQEKSGRKVSTPPVYVRPDKLKKPVGRQFNQVTARRRYT